MKPRGNAIERAFQGAIVCRGYRRTWAFPVEVGELLEAETAGARAGEERPSGPWSVHEDATLGDNRYVTRRVSVSREASLTPQEAHT